MKNTNAPFSDVSLSDRGKPSPSLNMLILDNVVSTPRQIPRDIREDLATILIQELIKGQSIPIKDSQKFIQQYGIFYPLLIHLRHSELWQLVKELAAESPEVAAPVTELLITKIFDLIDQFPKIHEGIYNNLDKEMQDLLDQFETLLENTHDQWDQDARNTSVSWNDELSRLLLEFSELLVQITPDQKLSSDIQDKFCNDCFNAITDLETSLENSGTAEPGGYSNEMQEIINELKKAISEIKIIEPISGNDEYERVESGNPTGSGDSAQNGSLPLSEKKGLGNKNPQVEQPGSGEDSQQGDEGRKGDNSNSEDETEQMQGTNGGDDEKTGIGARTEKKINIEKISGLIRQVLDQLQKTKNGSTGSASDAKSGLAEKITRFSNIKNAGNLIQLIMEKSTFEPVNTLIQLFKPHLETINFLAQLFPSKDWGSEITALKKEYIANLEKYAKIVEKNDELKDIIRLIGRIELEYGIKKHSISPMGRSEVHSITLSNDISRLLPTEAIKFHHPVLRKKLYADFTEGKLLTYNLRGKNWTDGPPKKREQGPVVALVDTSSSMQGSPEIVAKAVVLALAKKMLKQERDVKVILFSGPQSTVEIDLTSKKKMAKDFLKFLEGSFGGGTDFNTALKAGLEALKQPAFKGADLLFITDGDSVISDISVIDLWKKAKEEQEARVFSLIIDNNSVGGLSPISDYTYFIQKDRHWSLNNSPATMIRFIASPNNPK